MNIYWIDAKRIKVYLHGNYSHSEMEEVYDVKGKRCEELFDAMYEVGLVYNFQTHKFELPEDE